MDSKSMRNNLIPITVRTLETIIQLLVKHAREDCQFVLSTFQERIRQLDVRPTQLDAFVSFVIVRFYYPHLARIDYFLNFWLCQDGRALPLLVKDILTTV